MLYFVIVSLLLIFVICSSKFNLTERFEGEAETAQVVEDVIMGNNVEYQNNMAISHEEETSEDNKVDALESGHCYRINKDQQGGTQDLDACLVTQLAKIENPKHYQSIITEMRGKYKDRLRNTINTVYQSQQDIANRLDDLQNNFDKHGLKTLSKKYYDTIYDYGDFAEISPLIAAPTLETNNNTQNLPNAQ